MQQSGDHARTAIGETSNLMNMNILDWIVKPRAFSKGQNLSFHIRSVKRFLKNIKAPPEYHLAILVNSLDEECQLQLFAHPEYQEEDADVDFICDLMSKIFEEEKAMLPKLVHLMEVKQESDETFSQFLARIRVEGYKMMGDERKEENERYILSAFINGLRNKTITKVIETLKPENSEEALKIARKADEKMKKQRTEDCFEITNERNVQPLITYQKR